MIRHRRKRRRLSGGVELNLAAMLDMAFQLLTFFILTFKPAPVEANIALHMPPPQPARLPGPLVLPNDAKPNVLADLKSLVITAKGGPSGRIEQMDICGTPVPGLGALDARLKAILDDPSTAFDQVLIQVSPQLRYNDLMQVIDVCTRQRLADGKPLGKLSFAELRAE